MMHFDFQLKTSHFANSAERLNLITMRLLISERNNLFFGSRLKSLGLIPVALKDFVLCNRNANLTNTCS